VQSSHQHYGCAVPVVAVRLDDVLRVAIAVAIQRICEMHLCPDSAHLLINLLAKVGQRLNVDMPGL